MCFDGSLSEQIGKPESAHSDAAIGRDNASLIDPRMTGRGSVRPSFQKIALNQLVTPKRRAVPSNPPRIDVAAPRLVAARLANLDRRCRFAPARQKSRLVADSVVLLRCRQQNASKLMPASYLACAGDTGGASSANDSRAAGGTAVTTGRFRLSLAAFLAAS